MGLTDILAPALQLTHEQSSDNCFSFSQSLTSDKWHIHGASFFIFNLSSVPTTQLFSPGQNPPVGVELRTLKNSDCLSAPSLLSVDPSLAFKCQCRPLGRHKADSGDAHMPTASLSCLACRFRWCF